MDIADDLIKKFQKCLEIKNTKISYFQTSLKYDEIEFLLSCIKTKQALDTQFDERVLK